jgi:hypothetical protein
MIDRIAQRTKDDCAICTVAMVMGEPYTYERVLTESAEFPMRTDGGKFLAWWEPYLARERFEKAYRPFLDLYQLPRSNGNVRGILGMEVSHLRKRHVVAVDELGIIDPADGAPDHIDIQEYVLSRLPQGFRFDDEFLAVRSGAPELR